MFTNLKSATLLFAFALTLLSIHSYQYYSQKYVTLISGTASTTINGSAALTALLLEATIVAVTLYQLLKKKRTLNK